VLFLAFLYGVYRLRLQQIHLKQAAEMEHFQAEHLAQVDRLKSRFFSSISHEFRTPLTLILGPTDQLLEVTTEHPSQKKLQIIKDNASKLFALVNQLLDFSRLESGMTRLQVSSRDIVKFLRRVVMSFESWAERKKINLDFQADVDSAMGFFDAEKVEKIVNNLVSNALKFTPEGGAVVVSLRVAPEAPRSNLAPDGKIASSLKNAPRNDRMIEGGLVIDVSDTGPGISPEHLPHIFDRFYRVDETHTTEGTGIGLALANELIDLHHGTITVESAPGKGSTFSVVLPIERSAYKLGEICETTPQIDERMHVAAVSHSAEAESAPTTPPAEGKPIVLLVEDNSDLRVYMREYLELEYAVQEAGNGKEGYDQALKIIPDIVVADVMMPGMDGMDLCRALKQDVRTSHVPVILLTARAGMESKIEGLETGADDYLTKPFETKELLARIRNLIELRRKLRARFKAFVPLKPGEITVSSMDDAFLAKVAAAVEQRMSDETFHVDELAADAGMSRAQLHRKFIALTDQSPGEFIRVARLHRAMELLRKNAGTVSEIAYAVGFSDPSYFAKSFHRQFGKSPGELRQS